MLRRLLLVGLGLVACAGLGGCVVHAHHGPNVTRTSDKPVVDVKARYRKHDYHAKGRDDDAPAHGRRGIPPGHSRHQSWSHVNNDDRPDH